MHQLGVVDERVLALFERDRIHHRFALRAFQAGLDHGEFRGIDHQRDARDVGLRRDQIKERRHRLFGIEQALVHIDVEDLRAVLHLIAGHGERCTVVAGGNELAKARRAGDIGAFADIDEGDFRRKRERFKPGQTQVLRHARNLPRLFAGHGGGDGADVIGRRAAAAADNVDDAGRSELAHLLGHHRRALVVMAELVRQSGIRVGANERVGDAAKLGDVRAHLLSAECAVQADRQRCGMRDRIPECLRRLSGEQAARTGR